MVTDLNPSEDYKTSVLSGLNPEAVMECAGRALSFWSYQMTQDLFVILRPGDSCSSWQHADKHDRPGPGRATVAKC